MRVAQFNSYSHTHTHRRHTHKTHTHTHKLNYSPLHVICCVMSLVVSTALRVVPHYNEVPKGVRGVKGSAEQRWGLATRHSQCSLSVAAKTDSE